MAGTPNNITSVFNADRGPSPTRNATTQTTPEATFKRSPSPEPPTLPPTTFTQPPELKAPGPSLKRSLSLEPPKGPKIVVTRAASPERLEHDLFKRPIIADTNRKYSRTTSFKGYKEHPSTQGKDE